MRPSAARRFPKRNSFLSGLVLFVFLFLCPLLAACPARAAEWNGYDWEDPYTIDSEVAPQIFRIDNENQFAGFRKWINEGTHTNATFLLSTDIDLGSKDWAPIGTSAHPFSGKFIGDGKTVSRFTIISDDYPLLFAGLFGYVRYGEISGLGVTDFVVSVDCASLIQAGGIAGLLLDGSNITASYAAGSVSAAASLYDTYAGGIAGALGISDGNGCTIANSYATGSVFAFSSSSLSSSPSWPSEPIVAFAGGLAGYLSDSYISNSYATGSVHASSSLHSTTACAGGLVGLLWGAGSYPGGIAASYATGCISADSPSSSPSYAGGLAGYAKISTEESAGPEMRGVFDKQGTGRTNGAGNNGSATGVAPKTNAEMISADILSALGDDGGSDWTPVKGYYPQRNALVSAFPEASAFSVVPVRFASTDTIMDTSHSVTWLFKVPLKTPEPDSSALSWDWTPQNALRAHGINSNDELRLGPAAINTPVLLTVTAENGKRTKNFLLRANAVYEYGQSDDPYGDKPVDPPFVPYYPPSPPGPEYGIRLDVPVRAADASYGTGAPVEVTVTNTGDRPTGALAILPSGPNSADFTLSPDSMDSIGAGGDTAFTLTVTPAEWLAAGDYALTVIVSGDHGITASFDLAITVLPSGVIPVTEFSFSISLGMTEGDVQIFEALASPGSGAGKDVIWKVTVNAPLSPDIAPRVVEIAPAGAASGDGGGNTQGPVAAQRVRVRAAGRGTAEIEVRTLDGGGDEKLFAGCTIAVVPAEPGPPAVIVEKQGGGCRGQAALGSVMGPAMLAPAVFLRRRKSRG